MKAKEYVKKYIEVFRTGSLETVTEAAKSLIGELFSEAIEISEKRNVKTPTAVVSVHKELNSKWNSIGSKLEDALGYPVLQRDGYLNVAKDQFEVMFELAEVERLKKVMPALNTTESKE